MIAIQALGSELNNARALFLFKLREARKGVFVILLVITVLVAANVVFALLGYGVGGSGDQFSTLANHYFMDYSVLVLVFAPLIVAYVFWQEFRGKNSIYPQTSISRFLSVQALSIFLVLLALCIIVVVHLLSYGIFFLIASLDLAQSKLIMGYSFSPAFLAAGFLAALVFLVMVTTTISFVVYAVRAFKLFAALPIAALPVFYTILPATWSESARGIDWVRMQLEMGIQRFFEPESLNSFLIACVVVTAALLLVSIALKVLLPDDKGATGKSWILAIAFAPYVALTLMIGLSIYIGFGQPFTPASASEVLPQETVVIEVDASQVPEGSQIQIIERSYHRDTQEVTPYVFLGLQTYTDGPFKSPWGGEAGSVFAGDSIVVTFEPARFEFASPALLELAQPEITARLDGDRLYLEHSVEGEGTVVFMPIWSMMGRIMQNQLDANPLTLVTEKEIQR
ncbi:MAG: hypothetical protein FWE48_03990 [Coriobacteriia bacterium]|nr:hypothetical protein [Coriobacteriia bacterium]